MAIEIVDFPIKNGDFPWQNVSSPEGIWLGLPHYAVNISQHGCHRQGTPLLSSTWEGPRQAALMEVLKFL